MKPGSGRVPGDQWQQREGAVAGVQGWENRRKMILHAISSTEWQELGPLYCYHPVDFVVICGF